MSKLNKQQNCRGCGNPLDSTNNSEAHIIPNALGGRLAPKGIICQSCNTKLDHYADNALIKAFGDWPTLLDIPRQRGKNPSKIIETRDGHKVRLDTDGSLSRVDIQYDVSIIPEGHLIEISAGDMKTFGQLLNRAAKDFPQFNQKLALEHANKMGVDNEDELKMSLDFSPAAVFGGVVTALWLFLIHKTDYAIMNWERLIECIQSMQKNGGTFRYLVNGLPGLNGPQIGLGNKIIIRSIPSTGELIAYVEILGIVKVGGVFAKSQPPSAAIEHIYVHDLLKKQDRSSEYSIDNNEFTAQNWRTIGLGATDADALRVHFRNSLDIFINHYRRNNVQTS